MIRDDEGEGQLRELKAGDRVEKAGGDFAFRGEVVARFYKRTRKGVRVRIVRYVVENDDGLLLLFNRRDLRRVEAP